MKPKILKTEEEYEAALKLVGELMNAKAGSAREDDLDLWAMLVEQYEEKHYPIAPPDPIEAIKFRMDQMGLLQKDLLKCIPTKSRVSEVLNRKRPLSLPMIRSLHKHLGIPAEVLVQEPSASYGVSKPIKKAARKRAAKKTTRAATS